MSFDRALSDSGEPFNGIFSRTTSEVNDYGDSRNHCGECQSEFGRYGLFEEKGRREQHDCQK